MRRSNRRENELRSSDSDPQLVVTHQADGRILIHALTDSHVQRLGLFDGVAAAWAAIDEIDGTSYAH